MEKNVAIIPDEKIERLIFLSGSEHDFEIGRYRVAG